MKLNTYIDDPNSAINRRESHDNVSVAASSIYTSTAMVHRDTNLLKSSILEIYEGNERDDDGDEPSMASVVFPNKSFGAYDTRRIRSNSIKDDLSLWEQYSGNEAYNMSDIEDQLENISVTEASRSSHVTLGIPMYNNKNHEETMPEQMQAIAMNSCMNIAPSKYSKESDRSPKRMSTKSMYIIMFCMLGAVALIILLSLRIAKRDERNEPSTVKSMEASTTVVPVQSPNAMTIMLPTSNPTYVQDEAAECADDVSTIRLGDEDSDCAYLASHMASRLLFCQEIYPHVYNVCRVTCGNCNISSPVMNEVTTEAPTMVETIVMAPTHAPVSPTSNTTKGQGTKVCLDDSNATIWIDQSARSCSWLASHAANQLIFCQPVFPLVYDTCKATCRNCGM